VSAWLVPLQWFLSPGTGFGAESESIMVEQFEVHGTRITYVTAEFGGRKGCEAGCSCRRRLPVEAWAYRIEDGTLITTDVISYVNVEGEGESAALDLAAEILRWVRELTPLPEMF
jgi:hypothetical protein